MEQKTNEKNCGNCSHFCQHYIASAHKFSKLDYGHCLLAIRKNSFISVSFYCEKWEDAAPLWEKKRLSAVDYILQLSGKLIDAVEVLEADANIRGRQ